MPRPVAGLLVAALPGLMVGLLVGLALLTPSPARAATPEFVADIELRLMWDRALVAVKAEHWAQADDLLRQLDARKPDDANVLTQYAFVRRHLGFVQEARVLYRRALKLDPDNLDAHEYAGEAALLMNDESAADAHLQALRRLCQARCEQYQDLQAAFVTWRGQRSRSAAPATGTRP